MNPTKVLLADDHHLPRAGIRLLINSIEGVEVVAEASDGQAALDQICELKPDIALLDIDMPKLTGMQVAHKVRELAPSTRVIILSMHIDEEYVREAVNAGASGYLLKTSDETELTKALETVASGGMHMCPSFTTELVRSMQSGRDRTPDDDPLTPRQKEVLCMIAEGKTTKAIAKILEISVKTVETHRSQLMDRLGIHEVAGLVRYAISKKMINA